MYSTCLFCHGALGRNEAIEHFPVGRRLAFDAATGRLWVVCPRCARWNLTPLEERWEAVEECERAFRGTRVRVSTDNIGLAPLADGAELVRIGAPLRPEFAAWRYGGQFARRRRRATALTVGGVVASAAGAGAILAGGLGGALLGALVPMLTLSAHLSLLASHTAARFRPFVVLDDEGRRWRFSPTAARDARLTAAPNGDPVLLMHYFELPADGARAAVEHDVRVSGARVVDVAGRLLPRINASGADASRVRAGVRLIEEAGDPAGFWRFAAANVRRWGAEQTMGDTGSLLYLPSAVRLALEMAAHEEGERRALAGELAALEHAWREAEELARIADDLLLPSFVDERLATLKQPTSRS